MALFTVAVLTGGCGGMGSGEEEGPFDAEAWILGPVEVRIGAVDDPAYAFATVRDLAVGPGGSVFSLHRGEAAVRRWTAEGRPDGTVGREGEGPGEFQGPGPIGFFGDTLWVMDSRAYRVSFFDPAGALLGTVTPTVDLSSDPDNPRLSAPRPRLPFRDGTLYGASPAWSDAIARGQLDAVPHVRLSPAGGVLDTIWVQEYRPTDVLALLRDQGGTFVPQPFGDGSMALVDDLDRLVVLDRRAHEGAGAAEFRVTALDPEGDTVFHTAVPYEPEPLPASRVDSASRAQAEQMHEFLSQMRPDLALGDLVESLREATYEPEHVPPVREMLVATDGHVWLRRFEPTGDGSAEWWILDEGGAPVGRIHTPPRLRVVEVTGRAVWGVETDELDVEYIVRQPILRRGS